MSLFATFKKGGVHPADKKSLSKDISIERLDLPGELLVLMGQHLGAPATLLKKTGDHVVRGEKIGEASSFISANVHSPVSGVIVDVRRVVAASGAVSDAAVIQPDAHQPGPGEEGSFTERQDWRSMDKAAMLSHMKEMGLVGQGGATFPAHVKFSLPPGKKAHALIVNCVECEPYLTCDYRLMMERADELLEGVEVCARIIEPDEVIIGIEANKLDAADHIEERIRSLGLLAGGKPYRVQRLRMKYPQGDEKQLVKATIGREIPSGKLPIDVGAVVLNAASALSTYKAFAYNLPCIERVVTVSGECIAKPGNYLVPIGTKASYLIEKAGGFTEEPDKLISGGPMMGFAFVDEDTPITKGFGGLLALKDQKKGSQTACISCGRCVSACPIGLQPTRMYHLIVRGQYAEAMKTGLMDCKECGCCAYSCPAHLDLVHAFKTGKRMGRKK